MSVSPSCALISLDREESAPHESLSALRVFLQEQGARVLDNPSPQQALDADMMILAGVSSPVECYERLKALDYERIVGRRVAGSRPVLGVQHAGYIFFEDLQIEDPALGSVTISGMGEWPGAVTVLGDSTDAHAELLLHAEQSADSAHVPAGSRFVPVVSESGTYAVLEWEFDQSIESMVPPQVSWVASAGENAEENERLLAVENGPLSAFLADPTATESARAFIVSWLSSVKATGRI